MASKQRSYREYDFLGMSRWQVMIIPLYNETRIGNLIITSSVEHRRPGFFMNGNKDQAYVCHKWKAVPWQVT